MQIDPQLSDLQNLLALINRDNVSSITLDDLVISSPVTLVEGLRNTSIDVSAPTDSPTYRGSYSFNYNRLNLQSLPIPPSIEIPIGGTVESVKNELATLAGLIPSEVMFSITEFPTFGALGEEAQTTLLSKEGSYTYIGQVPITLINHQGYYEWEYFHLDPTTALYLDSQTPLVLR